MGSLSSLSAANKSVMLIQLTLGNAAFRKKFLIVESAFNEAWNRRLLFLIYILPKLFPRYVPLLDPYWRCSWFRLASLDLLITCLLKYINMHCYFEVNNSIWRHVLLTRAFPEHVALQDIFNVVYNKPVMLYGRYLWAMDVRYDGKKHGMMRPEKEWEWQVWVKRWERTGDHVVRRDEGKWAYIVNVQDFWISSCIEYWPMFLSTGGICDINNSKNF